ncbi:AraC family transcriptional regulator [Clostridium estertheticum]|uniref:AraC family transcriptional regulator n=1 Tax=Clostridium estertheticum TaxID=238834 RepID=UPI0013E94290|nr:helix-turn-helix domain-containing protein [Clostridium estertheticum]MBZ9688743.1 AraC family transcriptional regulator [Clostridium estertheticum]
MEWIERMTETVDYIEKHLVDEIMYDEVAKIACCSMHQFGRVFSYVVGISLSEYIRRRRLTLSALDLQSSNAKVIDVAMKYGYNSPDAFTRAFFGMHGVTPKVARTLGVKLKAHSRITFHISIEGDVEMEYRIEEKQGINLVGMVKNIKRQSANTMANDWKEASGEVWNTWEEFLNGGTDEKISNDYKLYRAPMWQMGFTKTLENGETLLAIGAEADTNVLTNLQTYTIPANKWVIFTAKGSLSDKEHSIDAMWTRITTEWFPIYEYKRAADYEIEVYPPGDTSSDDYTCEIWIPITE